MCVCDAVVKVLWRDVGGSVGVGGGLAAEKGRDGSGGSGVQVCMCVVFACTSYVRVRRVVCTGDKGTLFGFMSSACAFWANGRKWR